MECLKRERKPPKSLPKEKQPEVTDIITILKWANNETLNDVGLCLL